MVGGRGQEGKGGRFRTSLQLEEVAVVRAGEWVCATAREAGPSVGAESSGGRSRNGEGIRAGVSIVIVRDGGAAAEGVTGAEDNHGKRAVRDPQEMRCARGLLAGVISEAGVCGKGDLVAALVVRVDAEVKAGRRYRARRVLENVAGRRVGIAREVAPVGRKGDLVGAGALVPEVKAEARALGRAGHEEGCGGGGGDGEGRGVAGPGERQEVRVARGGGEEAAAEGAGHEM